ncbi:hypothetical protein H0H93_005497 [Arthromyces matolae]|nr:hypothetical protein H0H93_005497 [Arthromyces matolae]
MSDEEDGVSMIDSEGSPGRGTPLPPSDIWLDENGPPPYAHSHNRDSPHNSQHFNNQHDNDQANPIIQSPPNSAPVTVINYDGGEDMMIDDNPKEMWQRTEIPGVIVNREGLCLVECPPQGWPRQEYSSGPTQDLSMKSLAVVEDKKEHAVWGLLYKANNNTLNEQEIADAVRNNVGKLITIEEGERIGVSYMDLVSNATQESRLTRPWHILLSNLTPYNQQVLLRQYAFINKELVCWFSAVQEHKSHFVGMIVGFQHKKEDHDEVLDIVKTELAHNQHAELARFVIANSNPPDADAYHKIVTNLRIEFSEIKYKQKEKTRSWSVIIPPNNMSNLATFGFIELLAKVKFYTDGIGTGTFIKSNEHPLCDGCKGLGHYYRSCPYHDIPGWPLPKPTTTSTDAPNDQPRSWADLQDRDRAMSNNRGRGGSSGSNPRARGTNRGANRGSSNGRGRANARAGNFRGRQSNYYT